MENTSQINLSPECVEAARQLAPAVKLAAKDPDAYRAAMSASRAKWGDDLHDLIKGRALAGVTGGRA